MKILKYLLYVLIGLIAIGVILGLVGPKTYDVSRTAVISVPPAQLWPYVSSLQKNAQWTPWVRRDSSMVTTYTGDEGTVGSKAAWESKKMGKGEQTITALEPAKSVQTELKFYMPWGVGVSNGYISLQDTTGGTKMTWGIKGKNDFVGRIFGAVMNFDKAMGKDFEEGFANLQALTASMPQASAAEVKINPGTYAGGKYLGVRKTIGMDQMESFYSENLGKVFGELKKAGNPITSAPCGIYFTWDMDKKTTDMAAAVGFSGDMKKVPSGMTVMDVPAAKSLTIDYMGGYHGLGKAHDAMDAYLKANNLTHVAPVMEEYLTDPGSEPDSTKWLTRIVYFIK